MARILVIDDDRAFCKLMSVEIKHMGHLATSVHSLKDGLTTANKDNFDVIYLDVGLPDGNGLKYIADFQQTPPQPEIIIATGAGDPDGAELALTTGAWDYVEKGGTLTALTLPLVRALEYRKSKVPSHTHISLKRNDIVGHSDALRQSLDEVAEAASGNAPVLIHGETGTGKELFSRAVHENSGRSERDFVVVDCTALPETLVESMLFGHRKGSFTGALESREGLIKLAHEGTLFLDEIGDLPLPIQKSFLRVLENHTFRPVGGSKEEYSDFRLISATNRNLDNMVKEGTFRHDLLFRIRSFTIELPPLRSRTEDIEDIVLRYTSKICKRYGIETKGFSADFFDVLKVYHWPGNVRELINTVEKSISTAYHDSTVYPHHLPTHLRVAATKLRLTKKQQPEPPNSPHATKITDGTFPSFKDYTENIRASYLRELLAHTNGNRIKACRLSGLSKTRLYALIKEYDI